MDKFYIQQSCDRCGGKLDMGRTMSMFNTDCICIACSHKEKHEKDYSRALKADHDQIRKGNFNFKGIKG